VNGLPTLPGTFEVEFALRAARELRPQQPYLLARNARFIRFVRVPAQGLRLRAEARVVHETARESTIAVRLLSDFAHPSGQVLKRDILHFEGEILTSVTPFPLPENAFQPADVSPYVPYSDPYLAPGSPVRLGGVFACLDDIRIGRNVRSARFHLDRRHSLAGFEG